MQQIFAGQLARFPPLQGLIQQAEQQSPRTTSFHHRVFAGTAGPNWLIAGEAAAMVNSNGVVLRCSLEFFHWCFRRGQMLSPAAATS